MGRVNRATLYRIGEVLSSGGLALLYDPAHSRRSVPHTQISKYFTAEDLALMAALVTKLDPDRVTGPPHDTKEIEELIRKCRTFLSTFGQTDNVDEEP